MRFHYMRPITMIIAALIALGWWQATAGSRAAASSVSVDDFQFTPAALSVASGDTVTWTLAGGFHSVVADDGSFNSGEPGTGFPFSHTFNAPGTYRYYCSVHGGPNGSGMSGVITVTSPQPPVYISLIVRQ